MIAFPASARVWLAVGRTDMRRGMTGLALQVQDALGRDPHGGDLYVFRGARGDRLKFFGTMVLACRSMPRGWRKAASSGHRRPMARSAYRRRSFLICSMGSTGGIRATPGGLPAPDKIGRLHFPGVIAPDL